MNNLLQMGLLYLLTGLITLVLAALAERAGGKAKRCCDCNLPKDTGDPWPVILLFVFWPVAWGLVLVDLLNELYYFLAYGK